MTLCWPFIVLVCVCVCGGQRISLSALVWNSHKGLEGKISHKTGSGGGREVPEKTERVSWQRRAEENSRLEIAVQRRTQSAERGSEKMESEQSRDESAFLVALCKFRAKYTICWGFYGVQEEIPSEEASNLQIRSVAFPPG